MTPPIVPNSNQPLVDNRGMITQVWLRFFNAILGAPAAIAPVSVSASPTSFTAPQRGTLGISAGTLTSVTLTRAGTTVALGTTRSVTVGPGDVVVVSYSVAPTMNFIPF